MVQWAPPSLMKDQSNYFGFGCSVLRGTPLKSTLTRKISFIPPSTWHQHFLRKLPLLWLFCRFASTSATFLYTAFFEWYYLIFWLLSSITLQKDDPEKTSAVIRGDFYLTGGNRYCIYFSARIIVCNFRKMQRENVLTLKRCCNYSNCRASYGAPRDGKMDVDMFFNGI